jgi:hypothetical protein
METTDASTSSAQLNTAEWVYRLLAHIKDDSFTLPGCRHSSFFSLFPLPMHHYFALCRAGTSVCVFNEHVVFLNPRIAPE